MRLIVALALAGALACKPGDANPPASSDLSAVPATSATSATSADTSLPVMTVYKSPTCGCCQSWVDAVKQAGFRVEVHDVDDVTPIKDDAGVPQGKRSCHTAIVGGYAIEGHVPPETIKKFLREHPAAAGLAVPDMPVGAPGMEMPGQPADHYDVIAFRSNGTTSVYESH